MTNPKISIIVPVYKVEKYIDKCVESILSQTFKDFELILVDDGSPDLCPAICDTYALNDKRVKVIHKENGGLSDARNAGIVVARGDYLGFVDSDDYVDSTMYEKLYNAISDADLAVCGAFSAVEDKISVFVCPERKETISGVDAINSFYSVNGVVYIMAWNKLYKRELFDTIRYPFGRIHEDESVAHELMYLCKKIVMLPECLYYYVCCDKSIMNSPFSSKRFDAEQAVYDRIVFLRAKNLKAEMQKSEIHYWYIINRLFKQSCFDLTLYKNEFKHLKKHFNSLFFSMIKNNGFSKREKMAMILLRMSIQRYKKKFYK